MSLIVSDYPVKSVGQNVFAGKSPIEIEFKREDIAVIDTSLGINGTLLINVGADLSSELNLAEYVYLKSGNYDVSGQVLEITSTTIRLNTLWFEGSVGGYVNYKQNYYIELQTIDPVNDLIQILPFNLADNGDIEGNIKIDLSLINDLNTLSNPEFLQVYEMTDSRIKFDIKHREIWRETTGAYTRISDPIIIIPAEIMGEIESFPNNFTAPEYYKGYPNGAIFIHSDSAPIGSDDLVFYYDELDINKEVIKDNSELGSVQATEVYGRIFTPMVDLPLLENAEFITIKSSAVVIPEFNPLEFSNEFNIGE